MEARILATCSGNTEGVREGEGDPESFPETQLSGNTEGQPSNLGNLGPFPGKVFVILQLSLTLTGVVTSTLYNKIYQLTMEKFIGTCFALSSFLSFLAILPIG